MFAKRKATAATSLDGRHVAALLTYCDTTAEMRRVVERELTTSVARRGGATAAVAPYQLLVLSLLAECQDKAAAEICSVAETRLRLE